MSDNSKAWLLGIGFIIAFIGFTLITIYGTEGHQMTNAERIELVATELDLPEKHIRMDSIREFGTINGTYSVEFGENDDKTYFIRTITKQ